jgi:integrase
MRTVTPKAPGRRPNAELRTREHLTAAEVDRLMEAVKDNRQGHRDATMILLAYRHGLRGALSPLRGAVAFKVPRPPRRRFCVVPKPL